MKKKGFTLVELLAVIAILAILVIIALPNVMSMFNQAKENSFTTEIKEIYKQAQQQWISDSMINTNEITYYRAGGTSGATNGGKQINLTGRTELNYYIVITKSGDVKQYFATDGSYQYAYLGGDLEVENIGKGTGVNYKYDAASDSKYVTPGTDEKYIQENIVEQVSSLTTGQKIKITGGTLPTLE